MYVRLPCIEYNENSIAPESAFTTSKVVIPLIILVVWNLHYQSRMDKVMGDFVAGPVLMEDHFLIEKMQQVGSVCTILCTCWCTF